MTEERKAPVFDSHDLLFGDEKGFQPDHTFGRYRIERSLGSGAMATVMLATDTVLGRKVALKVPLIKPEASNQLIQKRFLREAKAAASLSHPNICPIHDVGIVDNSLYISMAYVEGISLVQVMEETEEFEEKEVAQIIRSIAAAVAEAHHQGILHRDLKPGNIMIDRRGEPVVLDFGLASFYQNNEESVLTLDGHALGTPAYMSPEQAEGQDEMSPATDIFSLGVIMWEMLTGERLFTGDTLEIMGKIIHGEVPRPSSKRPGISPDMEAICLKAIAKAPEDRYATMDDIVQAIEGWLQMRGVNVVGGSGSGILVESQSDISIHDFNAVLDQTRHEMEVVSRVRDQRWMLVIAILAGIIGLLLWLLLGKSNDSRSTSATPSDSEAESSLETGLASFNSPPISPDPNMSAEELFREYDQNLNGRLEPQEFPRHIIERADLNRDRVLVLTELQQGIEEHGGHMIVAPPEGNDPYNRRPPGPREGGPGQRDGQGPPPRRPPPPENGGESPRF